MSKIIQFFISFEDGTYTASGVNAPIVTEGKTFEELQVNIKDAVSLYLTDSEVAKEFISSPAVFANFEVPILSYAQ